MRTRQGVSKGDHHGGWRELRPFCLGAVRRHARCKLLVVSYIKLHVVHFSRTVGDARGPVIGPVHIAVFFNTPKCNSLSLVVFHKRH